MSQYETEIAGFTVTLEWLSNNPDDIELFSIEGDLLDHFNPDEIYLKDQRGILLTLDNYLYNKALAELMDQGGPIAIDHDRYAYQRGE